MSLVGDLEGGKFNAPLRDPSHSVAVIDNVGQWSLAHHCDWVLLKVMPHLPRSKEYSISYLLVVRVTLLGLLQDLAHTVNWSLKESKQRYPHYQKIAYGVFLASRK